MNTLPTLAVMVKASSYHDRLNTIIGALRNEGNMLSSIVTRLRLDLEHLFQASNQLIYIGRAWPTAAPLTAKIGDRLHLVMDDISAIVKKMEGGRL